MKPEKFDGKGSFETFLCQFKNCSQYNGWDEENRTAYLRWSLSGVAAQLLWNAERLSYKQLVDKLRDRFSGKGMEEKFQNALRCRRRSKGELIRELAQDVRRLMTLAYPGEHSSLSEHIARDAFLSAIDEPDLELKVREREPPDFDTAVKLAQRFELFKNTVDVSSSVRHRFNRQVINDDQSINARIEKIEDRLQYSEVQPQRASKEPDVGTRPKENMSRHKSNKNRAVSYDATEWKNEMMRKMEQLQMT